MRLLTVAEAADILGLKQKTLRDWIWKKKIETVRKGSRYVRINEAVVQDFIDTHTVPTTSAEVVEKNGALGPSARILQHVHER